MSAFKSIDIAGPAFGFNEAGLVLYINRLYRRVQRLDPTVDTPEKFITFLLTTGANGLTGMTQGQLNREFRRFLAHVISWKSAGGVGSEAGEGIGSEVSDDGSTA